MDGRTDATVFSGEVMPENTFLYRQVHPSWVQAGRITSQVFKPTPKDENKLSAYDGDRISAEKAWIHYTRELSLSSCGVVAVTRWYRQAIEKRRRWPRLAIPAQPR
jgi:hypothetical protein